MTGRDDFEHRLSQGLKRWAQAGEPSMDLEAYVRGDAVRRTRRRWSWLGGAAAAAAVALALGLTFPRWAGAAAELPLVGPVITRIILEDAGLKWAYDRGLIDGNVAEVTQNGVTVRILGVVADARRTTVLYRVLGAPGSPHRDGAPVPVDSLITPPRPVDSLVIPPRTVEPVVGFIDTVNGQGATSSFMYPEETPLGHFGVLSTLPLETEEAELGLTFRVGDEEIRLTVPASRQETDKFSREVAVNQTLEHDGVRVTVESVIYTPAETVVRYREEKEHFQGSLSWDPEVEYNYLEVDGRRYPESSKSSIGVDNVYHIAFPPMEGPSRLVLRPRVKGVPIEAVWPLEEGAVAEVMGVPITLVAFEQIPDGVGFRWEMPDVEPLRGIAGFEVIDAEGQAHPLGSQGQGSWASTANFVSEGVRHQRYASGLSEGVEPVAVRATRAAVAVEGPWVFELPGPEPDG